jgi:putative alpha-1,2-mannosidase
LPGNDDAGSTSAWMVFAALGLYPVAPGAPYYVLNSPTVDEAVLQLGQGEKLRLFRIVAQGQSAENHYIQEAFLNGQPLHRPWLYHHEITAGGKLIFELGPDPSSWGALEESAPPSLWLPK